MRILIAGCGDVGAALGVELATGGHEVWGLRRDPAGLPAAIRPLRADLTRPATLIGLPRAIDIVVYTAAPGEPTDGGYRAIYVEGLQGLLQALAAQGQAPHRIVFTSSTAVYGQTDGSWVNEASPTEPRDFRGRRLLQAERLFEASGRPATVVRWAESTVRAGRGSSTVSGAGRPPARRDPRGTATGSTATTVPGRSATSSSSPDQRHSISPSTMSPRTSARCSGGWPVSSIWRRRRGNKRCRNDRLVASGYRFRHPTFRDGYAAELRGLARRADPTTARHPRGYDGSERERER